MKRTRVTRPRNAISRSEGYKLTNMVNTLYIDLAVMELATSKAMASCSAIIKALTRSRRR